jgi:hypothetical protein
MDAMTMAHDLRKWRQEMVLSMLRGEMTALTALTALIPGLSGTPVAANDNFARIERGVAEAKVEAAFDNMPV